MNLNFEDIFKYSVLCFVSGIFVVPLTWDALYKLCNVNCLLSASLGTK